MKILLDLNGWRKEERFFGSVLSGRVEMALYPPMDILVRKDKVSPIPEPMEARSVAFEYRGRNKGGVPIFEYAP